jgi:hypothetical protein
MADRLVAANAAETNHAKTEIVDLAASVTRPNARLLVSIPGPHTQRTTADA